MNVPIPAAQPVATATSAEPGAPNIWLMGELSSGKTASLRTLIKAGVEVFLITTEPGFADILGDIPPDKLHWRYIPSYNETLSSLRQTSIMLKTYDMESIKKMPGQNRGNYNQWFELLNAVDGDFIDDRTGKSYGKAETWGPDRALVVDGLSGVNNMACRLVAGDKPFMSWPEFEAAQFCVEQFVNTVAQGTSCWFIMTSHIEREMNPVTNLQQIMPSTIGKVLAPRLPKYFSECLLCKRTLVNGKLTFIWDNITPEANVKFRNLPPSQTLTPDFGVIKSNWEKKIMFSGE